MSKKTKILYIITKANWGGAQKYVYELATNLPKDQFEVVVLYGGSGVLADKLADAGVRGLTIPGMWRDVSVGQDIKSWWQMLQILRQEKPDVVHLNSSKVGGLGAIAARLAGVPKIVFTIHGWAFDEERPWWQKILIKIASWITLIFVTDAIAMSQKTKEQTKGWPGDVYKKITTVYNGITTSEIIPYKTKEDLDLTNEYVIVGTIAELTKNKGLWYAIKAMKELANRKILLFIIGDGEERDVLEGLVAKEGLGEKVFFMGFKDKAQTMLKMFDIFILPSIKEGVPYVLLEAGLAERPVIASNVGSISEVILDGETGVLIPPRDVAALANAIDILAGNTAKRTLLGRNLREKVVRQFSHQDMLAKTLAVYTQD